MSVMDKYLMMGGRDGVKKSMLTSFISTGASGAMSKDEIARAAKVKPTDKGLMKHIEVQLKRRDARDKH